MKNVFFFLARAWRQSCPPIYGIKERRKRNSYMHKHHHICENKGERETSLGKMNWVLFSETGWGKTPFPFFFLILRLANCLWGRRGAKKKRISEFIIQHFSAQRSLPIRSYFLLRRLVFSPVAYTMNKIKLYLWRRENMGWRQLLAKMENGLPDTFKIWTATTRHEFPSGDRFKMHGKKELLLLRSVSIGIGPLDFFWNVPRRKLRCGRGNLFKFIRGIMPV